MVYFLKKTTPSKKGLYLQIYQSYYVPGKGKRNKSYQVIGYVDELKEGEKGFLWFRAIKIK